MPSSQPCSASQNCCGEEAVLLRTDSADKMMLHFVNLFLLWSLSAAQLSDISQPVAFQAVKLGDSATIECHIKSELKKRVWYRFTPGEGLQLVAAFNYFYNQTVFADKSHFRYSAKFDRINSHLSISATTWEDAGTYFCGVLQFTDIQFGSGTFLMLKAQHTHHSAPQLMSSSGEKTVQSEGTTCLYSHLMRNRSSDDAGTYFCIVTSCGQTLLGNGSRINIHIANRSGNNEQITDNEVLAGYPLATPEAQKYIP
ncbi:uncharacterized protein PEZ65_021842 [Lycodopsis pacificus]